MSDEARRPSAGTVRAALQQLSAEERERLVKALAAALVEQIREQQRVEGMRRLR